MLIAKNSFEHHAIRVEKYSARLTQKNNCKCINVSPCQHSASVLEESICDRIYVCNKFKGQGRNEKIVLFSFYSIFVPISLRELQILISGIKSNCFCAITGSYSPLERFYFFFSKRKENSFTFLNQN